MSDARSRIGSALEDKLTPEQIRLLLDEILAIQKQGRGWCPNCRKAVVVEVADAKAVAAAVKDLLAEAWGRPRDEQREEAGVTFIRRVEFVGPEPPAAA